MTIKPVDYENSLRILSIDPASGLMGVTIGDMNLDTGVYTPIFCQTYNVPKLVTSAIREEFWNRKDNEIKLYIIKQILTELYYQYYPATIVHEAAFCNPRLVTAYRSLTRCIMMLDVTFMDIDSDIPVREYEATKVKKRVQAKGHDKNLVRNGVIKLIKSKRINFTENIDHLDEHSVDSMAIGFTYADDVYRAIKNKNYLFI